MTEDSIAKLKALLQTYAERKAKTQPATKGIAHGLAERKKQACADCLRNIVRPVLEGVMTELKASGHEASTRDNTTREDAYPSVALSFTPRAHPEIALASALIFKYDPRRGILVQRDVKHSPTRGRVTASSGDRTGTIGVDALTSQWVETKTLNFIEEVLKEN